MSLNDGATKMQAVAERIRYRAWRDRRTQMSARAVCRGKELRVRNQKASSCMRPCVARSSHFYRAKFIPKFFVNRRSIAFTDSAMVPDLFETEMGKQHVQ